MKEDDIMAVMSSYENMAPMAYTYSFSLIYQWYLSDSKASKDSIDRIFYAFRDTGYTSSGIKRIDNGIAFMKSPPRVIGRMETHYFRNELNLDFTWDEAEKFRVVLPDFLKFLCKMELLASLLADWI
jgi:hypothetical protein